MFKKLWVEENNVPGHYEFDTTMEAAQHIKYSPSKINQFVKSISYGAWHKVPGTNFRIAKLSRD